MSQNGLKLLVEGLKTNYRDIRMEVDSMSKKLAEIRQVV